MIGPDGKKKYFVDAVFLTYFALITILVLFMFIWSNHHRPKPYQNCDQIKVSTGRSYIKEGDPLYQRRLDDDNNKIACE